MSLLRNFRFIIKCAYVLRSLAKQIVTAQFSKKNRKLYQHHGFSIILAGLIYFRTDMVPIFAKSTGLEQVSSASRVSP